MIVGPANYLQALSGLTALVGQPVAIAMNTGDYHVAGVCGVLAESENFPAMWTVGEFGDFYLALDENEFEGAFYDPDTNALEVRLSSGFWFLIRRDPEAV